MRQGAVAKRSLAANQRIETAVIELIDRSPLSDEEKDELAAQIEQAGTGHHDAKVRALWKLEAMADVLEAMASVEMPATEPTFHWTAADDAKVLAIPGIGAAKLAEIKATLGVADVGDEPGTETEA